MKTRVLVFTAVLLGGACKATAQQDTTQSILIEDFLNETQKGLALAQAQLQSASFPPLASVTLQLQMEVSRQVSGGFKILIFTFGKTWERSRSQEMTLVLRPPPPSPPTASAQPSVAEQLVRAIVSAAEGVKLARDRQPPLLLDKFEATFAFVVKTTTSAGVNFEIVPVTGELKGDLTKRAVHTLTVTFAR